MGSLKEFLETQRVYGIVLKNLDLFLKAKKIGFEYLLNPETGKLHRVSSDFIDSHNLHLADLGQWIGLTNIGLIDIHKFPDGTEIPIFGLYTGELIDTFTIDKCEHCRWE